MRHPRREPFIYTQQQAKSDTVQYHDRPEVRVISQLQFLSWPDHDVPHEASLVLDLLHRVQDLQQSSPDLVPRVQKPQNHNIKLVHCSAGCGRTGVICALDQIYQLLVHQKLPSDFSIMRIVTELRGQRPSAVQTKEQYRFIYTATSCLLRWFLQKNSSTSVYCNLPEVKKPQRKTCDSAAVSDRSEQETMDVTYAVVNKKVAASQTLSRAEDSTHHYSNMHIVAPAPIYSVVRPRAKPHPSETHLYDLATPTAPPPATPTTTNYHMISDSGSVTDADHDYENLSSNSCSSPPGGGIGFNNRVPKPRGPREPPAESQSVFPRQQQRGAGKGQRRQGGRRQGQEEETGGEKRREEERRGERRRDEEERGERRQEERGGGERRQEERRGERRRDEEERGGERRQEERGGGDRRREEEEGGGERRQEERGGVDERREETGGERRGGERRQEERGDRRREETGGEEERGGERRREEEETGGERKRREEERGDRRREEEERGGERRQENVRGGGDRGREGEEQRGGGERRGREEKTGDKRKRKEKRRRRGAESCGGLVVA
uniref:protein-tyrosine-phosphatase n=1 Tax=Knipowitschia caucasica TaxID=637954 RepID=A0AAV2LW28_KNICA